MFIFIANGQLSEAFIVAVQSVNRVRLFATPRTIAPQAPLSMGFPRQEHWSRLPFPSPGDLPNPGMEPTFLTSPSLAGEFFTPAPSGKHTLSFYIPISDVLESSSCFKSLPTNGIDHFFNFHHSNIVYCGVNFCFPCDK